MIYLILIIFFLIYLNRIEPIREHYFKFIPPSVYVLKNIKKLDENEKIIYMDDLIPSNMKIKEVDDKGWGIMSNTFLEKDKIICKSPIKYYNKKFNPIVITTIGKKEITKEIHSSRNSINGKYLFDYWNIFLNHDDNENAYYDDRIYEKNNKLYSVLRAKRDINKGEEILINYNRLVN